MLLTGCPGVGPREQLNQNTAFVDSSHIYGQTICDADTLRHGLQPFGHKKSTWAYLGLPGPAWAYLSWKWQFFWDGTHSLSWAWWLARKSPRPFCNAKKAQDRSTLHLYIQEFRGLLKITVCHRSPPLSVLDMSVCLKGLTDSFLLETHSLLYIALYGIVKGKMMYCVLCTQLVLFADTAWCLKIQSWGDVPCRLQLLAYKWDLKLFLANCYVPQNKPKHW